MAPYSMLLMPKIRRVSDFPAWHAPLLWSYQHEPMKLFRVQTTSRLTPILDSAFLRPPYPLRLDEQALRSSDLTNDGLLVSKLSHHDLQMR